MPKAGIRIRRFTQWSAALAVVFATGELHARIPPTTGADRGEGYLPLPELARAMSLGFDALLADERSLLITILLCNMTINVLFFVMTSVLLTLCCHVVCVTVAARGVCQRTRNTAKKATKTSKIAEFAYF